MKRFSQLLLVFLLLLPLALAACGDDDDDNDDNDDVTPDDDTVDDDTADDDTADDDIGPDDDDVVPTTVDATLIPVEGAGGWEIGEGPGEVHELRNDLGALPTLWTGKDEPLSMAYFMVITDLHQVDEESPTRLTFFDSMTLLGGAFDSAFRPQEDLAPHLLNALARTANRIQADYGRGFDFALALGDMTDNGQYNELKLLVDVLDGGGLTTGVDGYAGPDSGDLDIDPSTGLNRGERNFGVQEEDGEGNNINFFNRPGYPNSNADIPVEGLRRPDGEPLTWFAVIGNHDVLSTGTFDPDSALTFYKPEHFNAAMCMYGYIPGIASVIKYWKEHPLQPLYISDGLFGMNLDWRIVLQTFQLLGQIPDNYEVDIDDRFDLMTLVNDTPEDPSDDGVAITADPDRVFMRHELMVPLLYDTGHGFADNNGDKQVTAQDGGYYRVEWSMTDGEGDIPLRVLVLDSGEITHYDEGGFTPQQLNWLQSELDQAVVDQVLVVVANHHYNEAIPHEGEQLRAMLNACPNVIAHLVGHGHINRIVARPAENSDPLYGYWEVETAAGIEFPNQGRIVEIVDNRDGTGTIYVTLYDLISLVGDDSDELAALARELSFDDILRRGYDGGDFGGRGTANDRNRGLLFQMPAPVADKLAGITNDKPITSTEVFGTLY